MAVRRLIAQPPEECWLHANLCTDGVETHPPNPSVTSGPGSDQI
jgi:hypothetical protein